MTLPHYYPLHIEGKIILNEEYSEYKWVDIKEYLDKPGFKLIERPDMEMIELADSNYDVLAYFSNPTLGEVLGIK